MKPTSALFEAFLKCPTKCLLRSSGLVASGNLYAEWLQRQNEAYKKQAIQALIESAIEGEVLFSPDASKLKSPAWLLAVNVQARTTCFESLLQAY